MNRGPLINLIGACVIFVLVLVGYGFAYSLVSEKSAEVATLSTEIQQQTDATAKLEQANAALTHLSSQEASVNQYFVATSDIVPFLEQIQAIGTFLGANVQVSSVSAVPATATMPFGQLSLSLNITGKFDAVARTVGSIEFSPYDTQIKSLTLTATPNTTSSSTPAMWNAAAVFLIGAQTGTAPTTAEATIVTTPTATSSTSATPSSGLKAE